MNDVIRLVRDFVPGCEQEERDREQMLRFFREGSGWLTRENTVAHVTASSWVTDPDRSHVLMVWHNIYRSWSWTGGHADGEEDLMRVALRETEEETGVKARILSETPVSLETLCVRPHIRRGERVSAHLHLNLTWLMEADTDRALRIAPEENAGVRWIPSGEVLSACTEEEMKPVYEKLIGRMIHY